jgi:hypothetical protein
MSNTNLTAAQILEFRDYAWNTYHQNPAYLKFLGDKFGPESRADLESTLKVKLKRKLLGD